MRRAAHRRGARQGRARAYWVEAAARSKTGSLSFYFFIEGRGPSGRARRHVWGEGMGPHVGAKNLQGGMRWPGRQVLVTLFRVEIEILWLLDTTGHFSLFVTLTLFRSRDRDIMAFGYNRTFFIICNFDQFRRLVMMSTVFV
jgi:hypothetical protein